MYDTTVCTTNLLIWYDATNSISVFFCFSTRSRTNQNTFSTNTARCTVLKCDGLFFDDNKDSEHCMVQQYVLLIKSLWYDTTDWISFYFCFGARSGTNQRIILSTNTAHCTYLMWRTFFDDDNDSEKCMIQQYVQLR